MHSTDHSVHMNLDLAIIYSKREQMHVDLEPAYFR